MYRVPGVRWGGAAHWPWLVVTDINRVIRTGFDLDGVDILIVTCQDMREFAGVALPLAGAHMTVISRVGELGDEFATPVAAVVRVQNARLVLESGVP